MVWNPNPVLLDLGILTLHWYGLLFAGGFLAGYKVMQWLYAREGRSRAELDSLLLHVMVGTVVGARLVHCFFYEPEYYLARPLEIVMVWRGGLASHGGAAGLLLAVAWYCRPPARPTFIWLIDRLAIPATLAGAMIRLGNFFNSEIYGKPTDAWTGVVFAGVRNLDLVPRHPVQLYEAIAYLAIFVLLFWLYLRTQAPKHGGRLVGSYFVSVFAARFVLEYFKVPQAAYEADFDISVGQWLSVPFVLVGVALILRSLREPSRQRIP